MNTATFTSLSNAPILPICNYINAFSIFFINIDLLTYNEKNQSVPVINALFDYLNKSNNESLAKSHLLQEVFIKANVNQNDTILDMKYVNETYHYIIIDSLFGRCGSITEYLSGYENRREDINFSAIRNIVHEVLSDKCINNTSCSTRSGFKKLTPLAIQKLVEYVWSAYNQERFLERFSNNIRKEELTEHKRFRRQPPTYTGNIYDTVNVTANESESLTSRDLHSNYDITNEKHQQIQKFLHGGNNDQSNIEDFSFNNAAVINTAPNSEEAFGIYADINNKRLNSEDYLQRPIDVSEIELLINTEPDATYDITNGERQQIQRFLHDDANDQSTMNDFSFDNAAIINAVPISVEDFGLNVDTNHKKLNSEDYLQRPTKVQRIDAGNDNSAINTNLVENELDVDNVPGTSSAHQCKYSTQRKLENKKSVEMIDLGKSKRILSIEKAAEFISSCMPIRNSADIVGTLKHLLLKLEGSKTSVPTYDKFAIDFCEGVDVFTKYEKWKINEHNYTFIEDLLFQSYLEDTSNLDYKRIQACNLFSHYPRGSLDDDFNFYNSSVELSKSVNLLDFFYLKLHLQYSTVAQLDMKPMARKRLMVSLYRLALRESEEAWVENNATLFGYTYDKYFGDIRKNFSDSKSYTFQKYVEFSADSSKIISRFKNFTRSQLAQNIVMFTLKFDNLAGVLNIDRLFKDNTTGRYIVPMNLSFPIIGTGKMKIRNSTIVTMEIWDKGFKEEKMIGLLKTLSDLYESDKEIFRYYDPNTSKRKKNQSKKQAHSATSRGFRG